MIERNESIRNIAIIAHVDHGKTTLVDQMFKQSGQLNDRQTQQDRIMDNLDQERERGITITAKNCSVHWKDVKVNILDTPGHADFGGEVERALTMVDGAILLVDACEGPLPQTRYVLRKALELELSIIVVINKIDRSDARPHEVLDEIYDLFIDLDAGDAQLDFPVLYCIGKFGVASHDPQQRGENLIPLFDTICDVVPGPQHDHDKPFQMLVANLDYSDYLGRLAIGRVANGSVRRNDSLVRIDEKGESQPLKVTHLQVFQGNGVAQTDSAHAGDILILAGIDEVHIGDTICKTDQREALPRITVDEPTVAMHFSANSSPFSGREGQHVQSTKLRERLRRECLRNVALEVIDQDDGQLVKGRGELQLAILIEALRREGYEFSVGKPEVILRHEAGKVLEPIEMVYIDCEEPFIGVVSEKLAKRKGRMVNLVNHGTGRVRLQFNVPARSLIGFRNEFLTDTRGTGIINSFMLGYEPHRGDFATRQTGSIISDRGGETTAYALYNLEPRGILFVGPGTAVYEGMIIGEHNRDKDLDVNPCKGKKLTNMRASGRDDNLVLTPPQPISIESAIEFIRADEWVEVTPKSIRLRKAELSATERQKRSAKKGKLKAARRQE